MNEIITRLATSIALMVLAAIVMLAGFGFLLAAFYLGLLRFIEPPMAALAVGFSAFMVALILLLIARRSSRPRRRPLVRRPSDGMAYAAEIPGEASGGLEAEAVDLGMRLASDGRRLLRSHAKGAALTALCAGLVVGVSPRLRRTVWRFMQ
ncbi:MAG: phage holin family protein [Rhodospirillales bacterium]|nr:phage holin family protein [Rhodospirillales bacterium]